MDQPGSLVPHHKHQFFSRKKFIRRRWGPTVGREAGSRSTVLRERDPGELGARRGPGSSIRGHLGLCRGPGTGAVRPLPPPNRMAASQPLALPWLGGEALTGGFRMGKEAKAPLSSGRYRKGARVLGVQETHGSQHVSPLTVRAVPTRQRHTRHNVSQA